VIVRLAKILHSRPPTAFSADFAVRNYQGDSDIAAWLAIREAALAGQIAVGRPWTERDFRREFLDKPGWRADWMWFALPRESPAAQRPIGVVGMCDAAFSTPRAASVQWLMVAPEYRRRGAAGLLLSSLEAAAWDAGYRKVIAETSSEWTVAIGFYQAWGFKNGSGE
jgi:GNAT superfamily N-acetyltransferase